jgi:hypothetical protein
MVLILDRRKLKKYFIDKFMKNMYGRIMKYL